MVVVLVLWCGDGANGSGVGVVVWWRCWWVVVLVLWCGGGKLWVVVLMMLV